MMGCAEAKTSCKRAVDCTVPSDTHPVMPVKYESARVCLTYMCVLAWHMSAARYWPNVRHGYVGMQQRAQSVSSVAQSLFLNELTAK